MSFMSSVMASNFINSALFDILNACIERLWKNLITTFLEIAVLPPWYILNAAGNWGQIRPRQSPELNVWYKAADKTISLAFINLGMFSCGTGTKFKSPGKRTSFFKKWSFALMISLLLYLSWKLKKVIYSHIFIYFI